MASKNRKVKHAPQPKLTEEINTDDALSLAHFHDMLDAKAAVASDGQAIAPVKPELEVGKMYIGNDGKSYVVINLSTTSVVAKHDKKKIPFPRPMFEVLVGVMTEADYAAKQEVKREERKKKVADPKPQRVSGMRVIRDCLANNLNATVEDISKACKDAGVPKSNSTITTIMSDFKQTYAALVQVGRVIVD